MQTPFTCLDDCMARQLEAGGHLLEQLRQETAALQSGDPGRVELTQGPKQSALAAFAALDSERERLLREAGVGDTSADIEAWLSQADPRRDGSALARWRRLLALARECRQQNQVNGALIQAGLRHARQVFALLGGQAPDEIAPYAPPQGRKPEAPGGHSLGKA